jgi:hypothetical protein
MNIRFFLILFLLSLGFAKAQKVASANEVINRYLEVTKIKENAAKILDLTMTYTSESPRGLSETEYKYIFPFKFSMTVFGGGVEIMSSRFDGEKLSRASSFRAANPEPKTGATAKFEALKVHPFLEYDYPNLNLTTTLQANLVENNIEYYVVEVKDTEGKSWKDYYDVGTGLKCKTLSKNETPRGGWVESTIIYENYKALKGSDVLFPTKKKQSSPMGEISSELQSIKINKGLKSKDFEIK